MALHSVKHIREWFRAIFLLGDSGVFTAFTGTVEAYSCCTISAPACPSPASWEFSLPLSYVGSPTSYTPHLTVSFSLSLRRSTTFANSLRECSSMLTIWRPQMANSYFSGNIHLCFLSLITVAGIRQAQNKDCFPGFPDVLMWPQELPVAREREEGALLPAVPNPWLEWRHDCVC